MRLFHRILNIKEFSLKTYAKKKKTQVTEKGSVVYTSFLHRYHFLSQPKCNKSPDLAFTLTSHGFNSCFKYGLEKTVKIVSFYSQACPADAQCVFCHNSSSLLSIPNWFQ